MLKPVLLIINQHTKYEMPSFTSRYELRVLAHLRVKNTPVWVRVCYAQLACMLSLDLCTMDLVEIHLHVWQVSQNSQQF